MRIAIIPARGGSKRIHRKNTKLFHGKPLIVWSIEALKESGVIDKIYVSTDDDEIAEIAKFNGADVPFKRPSNLADDITPTVPVISHAIQTLEHGGHVSNISEVCCLYATAPFVTAKNIRDGLDILHREKAEYVIPVTTFDFPIQRALVISGDGCLRPKDPSLINFRSQDLELAYHDAGQFYWGLRDSWLEQKPIFESKSTPMFLSRNQVQDIDTPEDFERAVQLFSLR